MSIRECCHNIVRRFLSWDPYVERSASEFDPKARSRGRQSNVGQLLSDRTGDVLSSCRASAPSHGALRDRSDSVVTVRKKIC